MPFEMLWVLCRLPGDVATVLSIQLVLSVIVRDARRGTPTPCDRNVPLSHLPAVCYLITARDESGICSPEKPRWRCVCDNDNMREQRPPLVSEVRSAMVDMGYPVNA